MKPRTPRKSLTPEQALHALQEWTNTHKHPPTDEDLAKALKVTPNLVYRALFNVRGMVERHPPGQEHLGTYHLIPVAEIKTSYMSPEEILAKYGPTTPKAKADRIRALTESRVENLGTTTLSNPAQEQREIERQAESNVWQAPEKPTNPETEVTAEMGRKALYPWPSHQDLVERYDTLKKDGKNAVAVLCDEFGCPRGTLDKQIYIARKAVERQAAEAIQTIAVGEPEMSEPEEQAQQEAADALTFAGPPLTTEQTGQLWDLLGTAYTNWKVVTVPETDKYMAWHLDWTEGCKTGTWEEIVKMLKETGSFGGSGKVAWQEPAEAEEPVIPDTKTEYVDIITEFPAPCLMFITATETRLVELDTDAGYLPEVGDEWPEIYAVNGKRRVRIWHCARAAMYQRTDVEIRIMVPLGGVKISTEVA